MQKQGKYYASLEGLRAAFEQSKQSVQVTSKEDNSNTSQKGGTRHGSDTH